MALNIRLGLLLFFCVFLCFSPALKGDFLNWDDNTHLLENAATKGFSVEHLHMAFTQTIGRVYIPLTTLSFTVERSLFGDNPFVFHFDNVLLHAFNSCLVMALACRLGLNVPVAFFAALLFALHPMKVESVAWITERKDLLCAFFYFLSILFFDRYLKKQQGKILAISVGCGVLAILAKPMAISLPLVLGVWMWFQKTTTLSFPNVFIGNPDKVNKGALCLLPFFAYTLIIGWVTYHLHIRNPIEDVGHAVLVWLWCLAFYLQKFILPLHLNPLYEIPKPIGLTLPYLAAIVTVVVTILIFFKARSRWLIFAIAFYVCAIFFLLRFDTRADIHPVADRFLYIPGVGLFLGVSQWLYARWPKVFLKGALCVCLCFGAQSFYLSGQWQNSLNFWNYVLACNPQQMLAYNNRAALEYNKGQYEQAVADTTKVLRFVESRRLDPHVDMLQVKVTGPDGKEMMVNKIWHLDEGDIHFERSASYLQLKRWRDVIDDLNVTIAMYPAYASAYYRRGFSYTQLGDFIKAKQDFQYALMLDPNLIGAQQGLDYLSTHQSP